MSAEFTTIARPYAEAIFDYAVACQKIEFWQYMLIFLTEIIKNEQIEKLLFSNSIESEILVDLFVSICGDKLDQSGRNLIHLMAENNRLIIIPEVLKQFIFLREKSESVVKIQIISANTLSKEEIAKINSAIERRLSRKLNLDYKIDKSIVAGVIIRLDRSVVIDGSIRSRLERLADILQS